MAKTFRLPIQDESDYPKQQHSVTEFPGLYFL